MSNSLGIRKGKDRRRGKDPQKHRRRTTHATTDKEVDPPLFLLMLHNDHSTVREDDPTVRDRQVPRHRRNELESDPDDLLPIGRGDRRRRSGGTRRRRRRRAGRRCVTMVAAVGSYIFTRQIHIALVTKREKLVQWQISVTAVEPIFKQGINPTLTEITRISYEPQIRVIYLHIWTVVYPGRTYLVTRLQPLIYSWWCRPFRSRGGIIVLRHRSGYIANKPERSPSADKTNIKRVQEETWN